MTLANELTTKSAAVARDDVCSLALVRRMAAMLDLDPDDFGAGDPLPRGWHPLFFTADTRQSALKPDGMMSLGVDLPQIENMPRVVMGGRRTWYHADPSIGAEITRESFVRPVVRKSGRSGELAIVTVEHRIKLAGGGEAAIVEEQDFIFREAATAQAAGARNAEARPSNATSEADFTSPFEPDETMVFRYSALTYNTHRIHYDHPYATEAEGYPGIIVNGGLTTLMLIEAFKRATGEAPRSVASRNLRIVALGQPVRLKGRRAEAGWSLWAETDAGKVLSAEVA